jgi:hypothetical protein
VIKPCEGFSGGSRDRALLVATCFVLIITPFLFHADALIHGKIPWFMDTLTQFYPARVHAARLLLQGEAPLWNRSYFGGVPFLANPQWGLLYPPHWIMLALPGPRAYTFINAAHIALLGLGVFALLRRSLGARSGALRSMGPLLAGLLAETGGWTWAHLAYGSYHQVAAWFPWTLLIWLRVRDFGSGGGGLSRLMPWALLAGQFAALQLLAGAPQLALYCQIGLALFVVSDALFRRDAGLGRRARTALVFLSVQGLVALGLSAPQWMPARAFMRECERTGALPLESLLQGSLDARGLLSAFVGGSGRPEDAETILYPGIAAMGLALFAVFAALRAVRRKRLPGETAGLFLVGPSLLVLVVALLLCWRFTVPLWHKALPLFSHFHGPRRALFLAWFFTVLLAGTGWSRWEGLVARKWPGRGRLYCIIACPLLLVAAFEPLLFAFQRIDIKTIRPPMPALEERIRPDLPVGILGRGDRFFALDYGIQYSYNYTRSGFEASLLPNLGALHGLEDIQGYDPLIPWRYAVYMRRLNRFPAPAVQLYGRHFGLVRNPDSPWLSRFGRVFALGPVHHEWPFFPPTRLLPGEATRVRLRSPRLAPDATRTDLESRPRLFLARLADPEGEPANDAPGLSTPQVALRFMRGDKWHGSEWRYETSGGADTDGPLLWENVLPDPGRSSGVFEARFVSASSAAESDAAFGLVDAAVVENRGPAPVLVYSLGLSAPNPLFGPPLDSAAPWAARIHAPKWERSFPRTVISRTLDVFGPEERTEYGNGIMTLSPDFTHVEIPIMPNWESGGEWDFLPAQTIESYKIVEKKANRLRVELPAGHGGGWLVLSEPHMPGWLCRVDGNATDLFVADTLFRATPIRPGAREVVMEYCAPGLRDGLLVCLATLLAGTVLLIYSRRRLEEFKRDVVGNRLG